MSEIISTKNQRKFLVQWTFFNLLGWGMGLGLARAILFRMDTRNIETIWIAMSFFFIFGASLGTMQWLRLSGFRINVSKWVFATALGWSIGCSIWFMLVFGRDYAGYGENYTNWVYDLFIRDNWVCRFFSRLPAYRSDPYKVMVSISFGLRAIMSIIGAIVSGEIIGTFQLIMIRKFISKPVLWTRAYVFGLLLPTVLENLIFFVKSFLKKLLFSFSFIPPSYMGEILYRRWTLVFWFSILIGILSISILTGKALSRQSNTSDLIRA